MSSVTAIQPHQPGSLSSLDAETMQNLVAGGDCSRLAPAQKVAYYQARCEAAGLDPRAQPFAFMRLNGKEVLYAQKAASDQLAAKHGVRMTIVSQATEDGIRVVTVRAETKDGRQTDEIGAVPVKGLVGDALCNAMMKAVTKAKRRAVLSICGLGMLDETEVETIPQGQHFDGAATRPVVLDETIVGVKTREPPSSVQTKALPANDNSARVASIWARLVAEMGETKAKEKTKSRAALEAAGKSVFGDTPKTSNEWTSEDCAAIEKRLFDVPF